MGTQTFRMAGAKVQGTCMKPLFSLRENVRLGQGLKREGRIRQEAMERARAALESFKKVLEQHSVTRVRAVGTAALRQAANAHELMEYAAFLGLAVETINWQEEAVLAVRGAGSALGKLESSWAMIDVGGGSSEIVFCSHEEIISSISLEIGAVSLLDMLPAKHACDVRELSDTARQFVSAGLSGFSFPPERVERAVGTGGTATTVAAVAEGLENYDPRRIRGRTVSLSDLRQLLSRMCYMDLEERRKVKGLEPARADIFPAGIAILAEIVSYLELNEMTVSDGGLLSGLLIAFMEKECDLYVEPSCARSLYL